MLLFLSKTSKRRLLIDNTVPCSVCSFNLAKTWRKNKLISCPASHCYTHTRIKETDLLPIDVYILDSQVFFLEDIGGRGVRVDHGLCACWETPPTSPRPGLDHKFILIYAKRAFVHWYVREGMDWEGRTWLPLRIIMENCVFESVVSCFCYGSYVLNIKNTVWKKNPKVFVALFDNNNVIIWNKAMPF